MRFGQRIVRERHPRWAAQGGYIDYDALKQQIKRIKALPHDAPPELRDARKTTFQVRACVCTCVC